MFGNLDPILQKLIEVLLSVLMLFAIYGLQKLQQLVKAKMGEAEYDKALKQLVLLKEFVRTVVHALEQNGIYTKASGDEKKGMAMSTIMNWVKEMGFDVTEDEVDDLIEEAVHLMNGIAIP